MVSRLHITNGDVAANMLKGLYPDDDVLPWRDPMTEGPFPAGLDLCATSKVRAGYLAGPALPYGQVLRDFDLRDRHLAAAGRYDDVTLWFEHDLLDQLQLLQLLDWFATARVPGSKLGVICIGMFPGVEPFRSRSTRPLADGHPPRSKGAVTPPQLELAQSGWAAFRSPDPRGIEQFLQRDLQPFPFMQAALLRHLQELYPTASGVPTGKSSRSFARERAGPDRYSRRIPRSRRRCSWATGGSTDTFKSCAISSSC
jgi:hypothetical protein